jgi:Domain of unknown function (DUF4234)
MSDTPPPPPPTVPGTPAPPAPPTGGFSAPPAPAGLAPAGAYGVARYPGRRRAVGITILVSIVTCGIWTYVWAFQNGEEMKKWSGEGLGGALHLVLTIVFAPVTMFMLASEVEQLYRRDGQEPPITTIWGLWCLLPLIGNIVWYVRIQNAINAYWTAHGQTNQPGLT